MVYAREFDGEAYNFGVVGVDKGTLIMYDDRTRSRWSQLMGEAVEGSMKGNELEKLASTMTTWKQWKELHPDTTVYVKRSIEYRPRFTADTFSQIARSEPGPVEGGDLVIGVEGHVEAKAYLLRALAPARILHDELETAPVLVYVSSDLATVRILNRRVGRRTLTFAVHNGTLIRDDQTGTIWDPLTGRAEDGSLRGSQLDQFVATYSLWFAWKKYRPDTILVGEQQPAD